MNSNTDINTLTRLIETTLDSADGCEEAAGETRNGTLNSALRKRSAARRAIASRLQDCVRALGGEPDEEGAALASAHRLLLGLPPRASHHEAKSVVQVVRRGEAYLDYQFERAMQETAISPDTRRTIAEARRCIRIGQDSRRALAWILHG